MEQRVRGADLVFLGTVASITGGKASNRVSFEVIEQFKGPRASQVVVFTTGEDSSCRFSPAVGTAALIYAYARERGLEAHRCSGSSSRELAWPDLFYLRAPNRKEWARIFCPAETEPHAFPVLRPEGLPGLYCWRREAGGYFPDGPGMVWHHEGWKRAEGVYRRGQMHGTWTFFDREGSVEATAACDAGECRRVVPKE